MKDANALTSLDRRGFCAGAAGTIGAISLAQLACGGGGGGGTAPAPPPGGGGGGGQGTIATTESKSSLLAQPDGTVMHFGRDAGCPSSLGTQQGIFLAKDATGIYAMDASCTHLGGLPTIGATSLTCPCHGSVFDLNGVVTNGPATTALKHYLVKEVTAGGLLEVDTTSVVSATTRLT